MTQRPALTLGAALAAAAIVATCAGRAAAVSPWQAQPAGCESASTTATLRECLDHRLRRLDADVERAYARLRAVPGVDRARLAAAQAAWVRYRDAACAFAASLNAGGTLATVNDLRCRVTTASQRLTVLRADLAQAAPAPAEAPRCRTRDLRASVGRTAAAAGNRRTDYILLNASGRSCTLRGYPGMAFLDASGAVLRDRVRRGSGYLVTDPGPRRVVLPRGRRAPYSLGYTGDVVEGCVRAARVRITPPDERRFLSLPSLVTVCPGQPLVVSALVRGTGGAPTPP